MLTLLADAASLMLASNHNAGPAPLWSTAALQQAGNDSQPS